MDYRRILPIEALMGSANHFLFGPRSTGKTFLVRRRLKRAKVFDLLDSDVFGRLARRPRSLGEELSKDDRLVVIDEVQKLPSLLDEVQRLIETRLLPRG